MDRNHKYGLAATLVLTMICSLAAQDNAPQGGILYDMGVVIRKPASQPDSSKKTTAPGLVDSLQRQITRLQEQLDYYRQAFAAAQAKLKHDQAVIDSLYQVQEDLKLSMRTDLAALKKQLALLRAKQHVGTSHTLGADSLNARADSLLAELLPSRYPKLIPEVTPAKPLSQEQEQQLYRRAVARYNRGHFHSALEDFRELRSRAVTPRIRASAQYWIARAYFEQGYYDLAVDALDEVLQMPQAHQRDAALMLLGMALHELGRETEARRVYRTLVKIYPDSEYAPFARRFARRGQEREP